MEIKQFYEIFSLTMGFSAIWTILFFLITGGNYPIILFEPYWFIRIPEIIIGLIVSPYYVIKFKEIIKDYENGLEKA